jgi:hypothetical protein
MSAKPVLSSFSLPCSGTQHNIWVGPDGSVRVDKTVHDVELEEALIALGAEVPACLRLARSLKYMRGHSYGDPKRLLFVNHMLDVSTVHMTPHDNALLNDLFDKKDARLGKIEDGWFIWLGSDRQDMWDWAAEEKLSDSLKTAMDFAMALSCTWVHIGAYYDSIDGLPTNAW